MSKPEFTPGPWRVEPKIGGNNALLVTWKYGTIAQVRSNLCQSANANLLSAALEMYDALERIQEIARTGSRPKLDPEQTGIFQITSGTIPAEAAEILAISDLALAKADGRSREGGGA